MLQGLGPSSIASLGPSSLSAAASVVSSGLQRSGNLWPFHFDWNAERLLSTNAKTDQAPAAGPGGLQQVGAPARSDVSASSSERNLPLMFSLRPSVLSPLYSAWDHTRKVAHRREHLTALLKSHVLLSSSFRAKNDKDLVRKVRHRVQQIHQVSTQLGQLLDDPAQVTSVPRCPSPAHAAAYCAVLEDLALSQDPAAHDFARVQRGEASPWAHYSQHFMQPYRDAPRLEPLEIIYSKPDPAELVRQLYNPAPQQAARGKPSSSTGAAAAAAAPSPASTSLPRSIGPHIDVAGVTHSAGKRKASSATLDLVPGSGQITVNGLPIASYFREPSFRQHALHPLVLTGSESQYDITVHVRGGGLSGQAQAIRTAVARALVVQRPALAEQLEEYTRWDGRVVERKKPGRAKARRGYTWVKR